MTATEALAHPYFGYLRDGSDEPTMDPFTDESLTAEFPNYEEWKGTQQTLNQICHTPFKKSCRQFQTSCGTSFKITTTNTQLEGKHEAYSTRICTVYAHICTFSLINKPF